MCSLCRCDTSKTYINFSSGHFGQAIESAGGAEGNRTPDLRITNATLSHLSYGPVSRSDARAVVASVRRIMWVELWYCQAMQHPEWRFLEELALDAHFDILAATSGRGPSVRAQKHFERNP